MKAIAAGYASVKSSIATSTTNAAAYLAPISEASRIGYVHKSSSVPCRRSSANRRIVNSGAISSSTSRMSWNWYCHRPRLRSKPPMVMKNARLV